MTPRQHNILVRRTAAALRERGLSPALYHRPQGLAEALVERAERLSPTDPGAVLPSLVALELQAFPLEVA